ncbi:MAG: hypothetical protein MHM6MM_004845 [Cercozoa sp. M6MM]
MVSFLRQQPGGRPHGGQRICAGASDDSEPLRSLGLVVRNMRMYYARRSTTWQEGGVCFVDGTIGDSEVSLHTSLPEDVVTDLHCKIHDEMKCVPIQTLARAHLITIDQFVDVVRQENHRAQFFDVDALHGVVKGDLTEATVVPNSWYGRVINLGSFDGNPVVTFTCITHDEEHRPPSAQYVSTIARGIREVFPTMDVPDVLEYLTRRTPHRDSVDIDAAYGLLREEA